MSHSQEDKDRYQTQEIYRFAEEALQKSGVGDSSAKLTARSLWLASLRGVDSHGIRLLPYYLEAVKGGRINPNPQFHFRQTSPCTGYLDADHGFGHAAGIRAMHYAMELARNSGSGQVAVRNSTHCGFMAYFVLEACREDMIGMAYTNTSPRMRTANATTKFFGTNPLCMAAPMANEGPFCYDGATTLMSSNKIRLYEAHGIELPLGCGADKNGRETVMPNKVEQLLPIGGYKGFGIAMMIDIFCSLLTDMPSGDQVTEMFKEPFSDKRRLGQFYSAQRIDTFVEPEHFKKRLQDLADRVRRQPRQDSDIAVLVPGDPEKAHQADRKANGIPINPTVLQALEKIALELEIEPPHASN